MSKNYGGLAALILVAFVVAGLGCMAVSKLTPAPKPVPTVNPCTADASQCYSIQGLYSQPNCPGQRPWYVEASGQEFFMGCQ